jgi:hypothetical protein
MGGHGLPAVEYIDQISVAADRRNLAMTRHSPAGDDPQSMSERPAERRSAVVFGERNLGRAVIELLVRLE